MIDDRLRRREGARCAARGDHRATALLYRRDELRLEPRPVDDLVGRSPADRRVREVRVERRAVVAPDREVLDVARPGAGLPREQRDRPVLVEAGECGPAVGRHRVTGGVPGDEAVRIARVTDHHDPHVLRSVLRDGPALVDEDRAVLTDEVAALHAGPAGDAADEQDPVGVLVTLRAVAARRHAREQRIRAILELHDNALRLLDDRRDVGEPQIDLGLRAEHLARGNAGQERICDLTRRTGDDDPHGGHRFASAPP